jgi:hypothetical protein
MRIHFAARCGFPRVELSTVEKAMFIQIENFNPSAAM